MIRTAYASNQHDQIFYGSERKIFQLRHSSHVFTALRIGFRQAQRLAHGFQALGQPGIRLKHVKIGVGLRREEQFEGHGSVDFVVGELGEATARLHTSCSGLAQALLDGGQDRLVFEQSHYARGNFRAGF